MLSSLEKTGLESILNYLSDDELFSLLDTVTKRMFSTIDRQEAVKKILSCTARPVDLLQRQKITKRVLFNYLVSKGEQVIADWAKAALVIKCLELWNSTQSYKESQFVEEQSEETCDVVQVTSHMGVEFSKWFFPMLNKLNDFSQEHFWPNCKLSAELLTPSDKRELSVGDSANVVSFFVNLVMMDKYYFCANESSDSILLQLEPHGLVKIGIKGVLHQCSNCVGLFDSLFGLVRNPEHENNYKIQMIQLRMQVNYVPSLAAGDQLSIC